MIHRTFLLLSANSNFLICKKKSGSLPVVSNMCYPNPRRLGHKVFSDKGFVSPDGIRQDTKYRGERKGCWNCHVICEESLHPQKVRMWCALPRTRIIGRFFHVTVNTDVYFDIFNLWISWMTRSWHSLTFNTMGQRVTHLTDPQEKSGISLEIELSRNDFDRRRIQKLFRWTFSCGSCLEVGYLKTNLALLTTWKGNIINAMTAVSAAMAATFVNKECRVCRCVWPKWIQFHYLP